MALVNNHAALNDVYNYYLTTFAPATKTSSRYDTHKKSELRSVYNSIVKQNKESPLYILDTTRETQEFAVSVKENARQLGNTINSLTVKDSDDILSQKVAYSTDSDLVSAKYIGELGEEDGTESFDISVTSLAKPQINRGNYLNSEERVGLAADTYSFDLHINDTDYEFQFNIGSSDTNYDLQSKLEALINRSNVGVKASLEQDGEGRSALRFESLATGATGEDRDVFSVTDDKSSKVNGCVEYLGLDQVEQRAENAEFSLNGIPRSAFSNTFTVDRRYEISLNGITGLDSVSIGLKPDVEALSDNIKELVDSYNGFVEKIGAYSGSRLKTDTLFSEIDRTNRAYRSQLSEMGLTFDEDRKLSVDDEKLMESLESVEDGNLHNTVKNYAQALMRKTSDITLDPMNYVQKRMVAYKNPGHNFASPYITSIYSGMMFNGYC